MPEGDWFRRKETTMFKRVLILCVPLLISANSAHAQCRGWPVQCTGISPISPSTATVNGAVVGGLLGGFYTLGETLGTAMFGDVDAAMPWEDKGVAILNDGISVANRDGGYEKNCPQAEPKFVEAQQYLEEARRRVSINIGFNSNLDNVRQWVAVCGLPGDLTRLGANLVIEGDAFLQKGACRQALAKWAQAKPYYDEALEKAPYAQFIKNETAKLASRLEKLKDGEFANHGCAGMPTEEQQTMSTIKPAKRVDTTTLVQPRPGSRAPSQPRQAQQEARRCPAFGEPHVVCGASPGAAQCCPTPSPHCAADLSGC
jgi:hypothetical protein